MARRWLATLAMVLVLVGGGVAVAPVASASAPAPVMVSYVQQQDDGNSEPPPPTTSNRVAQRLDALIARFQQRPGPGPRIAARVLTQVRNGYCSRWGC